MLSVSGSKSRTKEQQNAINAKLLKAISDMKKSAFDQAMQEGPEIDCLDVVWDYQDEPSKNTPLNWAIIENCGYAAEQLIAAGASVEILNGDGIDPITAAIRKGNERIVEALLSKKPAQINLVLGDDRDTLLHNALFCFSSYSLVFDAGWGSDELKNQLKEFYQEKRETLPTLPQSITYKGNVDLIKVLLKYKPGLAVIKNNLGFSPLEMVETPVVYKDEFFDFYGKRTIRCLTPEIDARSNVVSFKVTMANKSAEKPFSIVVNYDFSEIREIFSNIPEVRIHWMQNQFQYQTAKTDYHMNFLNQRTENIQHNTNLLAQETNHLKQNVSVITTETNHVRHNVNLLTKQVNIQGALLNALTAALQPLFIKDRMEQEWRERLSRIKNNPLSEKFCITFNLGLRANVVASISFSSGEFQRQPPLGEEILTNVLEVALKSIPIFGQIVGSLVSGSITAFFDWKKENLHATTAKLFSFINTELFCDRLSIEIAEFCTPLFEKGIVKNEKHAEKLATNALAFVLYTMSRDDLVKLKGENPEMELRMQLGYFFIQSKLFEKYHKQFVEGVQGAEQQFISSSSSSNYVTPPQKVLTFSSAHVVSNKVFVQPALSPQEPISLVKTKNKKSRCLVM